MPRVEYASRPIPVFTKLAVILRNIPAVQFVFARFAALLHRNKETGEPPASPFVGEAPDAGGEAPAVTGSLDQPLPALKASGEDLIAVPESNDASEREKLIRRRWAETGIKMWNGHSALNIQGRADLLPVKPGRKLREYDRLEFKMIAGEIACEGVVVDPPGRRR
jgi:hypothetical protein